MAVESENGMIWDVNHGNQKDKPRTKNKTKLVLGICLSSTVCTGYTNAGMPTIFLTRQNIYLRFY